MECGLRGSLHATLPAEESAQPRARTILQPSGWLIGLVTLALALPVAADEFHLASGGSVRGEWLNKDQQPLVDYVVRTEQGIIVRLTPGQVREAIAANSAAAEYLVRASAIPSSAEAHWQLSQWCQQNGLTKQRLKHLQRTLELDEHHQLARRALGHQFIGGQWVLPKELREAEGFVYYRGRWRTPQEVDSIEAQAKLELAQKEWLNKLRRWRNDLNTERAKAAAEALGAVRDPIAVKPLAHLIAAERVRTIKQNLCDILARIESSESVGVLVQLTLNDADVEIFHHCLDKLVALKPPHISDPFVEALKDENNDRVQRAAYVLGRLKDPSTISPLIDALRTKHLQTLPGNGGMESQTFSKSSADAPGSFGSAAVSRGDSGKTVVIGIDNQEVLTALTKLTGASFGFDQRAWRYWHAQEKRKESSGAVVQRRE